MLRNRVRPDGRILCRIVKLHTNLLASVRRVLLFLVEVRDVAVLRLVFPSTVEFGQEFLAFFFVVHCRFCKHLWIFIPVLIHVLLICLSCLLLLVYISWLFGLSRLLMILVLLRTFADLFPCKFIFFG